MDSSTPHEKEHITNKQPRPFGMVIRIKAEQLEAYKHMHAGLGVRDLLCQANIHNFSIFLREFEDAKFYGFAYYEYIGSDYEADMAWLASQPVNKDWLAICGSMQIPLPGETGWGIMESIYYNK